MRVRKPRFSESALHLPHTCGFCRKGEAAAFYNMCALKNAAARKTPNAKRRTAVGTSFSLGVVLKLSAICFISLKQIARMKQLLAQAKPRFCAAQPCLQTHLLLGRG